MVVMVLSVAGSFDAVTSAYRWLEIARNYPPPRVHRSPDDRDQRQRRVMAVLEALVGASERQWGESIACGHAARVAALSHRLALAVGLSQRDAEVVGQAGLLHDIGKLGAANGQTGVEPVFVTYHPGIGAQLVEPFEFLALAAPMIRHHHERLDGSGYPDGLLGLLIPVGARIIAVADEYDRLTAGGGQAEALTHEAALARLAREAGRTLDTTIVSALIRLALP